MPKTIDTNCPFTLAEYRALLRLAKSRFPVAGYTDYKSLDEFVIWRHDVEYSIAEMSVLARIDAEEKVRATFFVQLHSDLYNFWDRETVDRIREWVAWGHEIGLHLDCGFHGEGAFADLERIVLFEKGILEDVFDAPVRSFAYHNPTDESLRCTRNYGGLVNAYGDDFVGEGIAYVSDSNGRWRARTVRDVLEDPETRKVQVNTHDTWWTDDRVPQIEKFEGAIMRDAHRKISHYRSNAHIIVDDIV